LFELDKLINGPFDTRIVNLIKEEFDAAKKSMQRAMASDLIASTKVLDAQGYDGLLSAIDDTPTSLYLNIDRNAEAWWKNQTDNAAPDNTLTIDAMRAEFVKCRDGNDQPTIIITTDQVEGFYNSLLTDIQRINNASKGEAGYKMLEFMGVPIHVDGNVTANHLYFINEKYCKMWYMNGARFTTKNPVAPQNEWSSTDSIFFVGAFAITRSDRQGVLTNVTGV
jgi:hypothetical protein